MSSFKYLEAHVLDPEKTNARVQCWQLKQSTLYDIKVPYKAVLDSL